MNKPGPTPKTQPARLPLRSRSEVAQELLATTPGLAKAMLKLHDDANSDSEKTPDPTSEQLQAALLNKSTSKPKR